MGNTNPRKRWLAIIAATSTIGAVGVALGLGTQLISILMAARGISASVIGYSGTIGGIATVVAAAVTSRIASRFGVVKPILAMLIMGAVSFLGFYVFSSIIIWFLLRFTLHFAMTVMFILSEFWVNHSAPAQKRGLVLAAYAITLGLGFTIGPTVLAFVGSEGITPFATGLILIFIAAIPIVCAWSLSPQFADKGHVAFRDYILKIPTSTMAVFVYGAIQMGALTLIGKFSLSLGYDAGHAARLMAMLALGNVLLLVPIGIINDRLRDRRYLLFICAIVGFFGTATIPLFADNYIYLSLDLFVLGGVSAGLYTVGLAQLGAKLKGRELAAANSAFIFCYGIGMLVGPTILGEAMEFYDPFGFSFAMAAFFAIYLIFVIVAIFFKRFRT